MRTFGFACLILSKIIRVRSGRLNASNATGGGSAVNETSSSQDFSKHLSPCFPGRESFGARPDPCRCLGHGQDPLTQAGRIGVNVDRVVTTGFAQLWKVACDSACATRSRLQDRNSESLIKRWAQQGIRTSIECRQVFLMDIVKHADSAGSATLQNHAQSPVFPTLTTRQHERMLA